MNGGYLPYDSLLHRTDAFYKLLCFFALIAALLLCRSPLGYVLILALLSAGVFLSRIGIRRAFCGLAKTWSFFLVIFLMNLLFYDAADPLWRWWIFRISAEGALQGARMILRLIPMLVLGDLLIATTTPTAVTEALESLLYPLKFVRLPVQEISMILGVSLQFIPTLLQEAANLRMAQTARGARFESKRLRERAACLLPLVVPLFLSAFRRADELSVAMEARGYRRNPKNIKFRPRTFGATESVSLLLCGALCAAQILI